MTPEEFKKVARAAVALNLDNSESVKKQGSRLVAARKKLKEYHAQIVAVEKSGQQPPFTVAELEDDPKLLKRLMAIQQKSGMILDDARWLKLIIESLSVDCNRLIGKAKTYLSPESAPAAKPPKASISSQVRSPAPPQPTPTAPNPAPSRQAPPMPEGLDFVGKVAFWVFPPSKGKNKWWVLLLSLAFWGISVPWLIWTKTNWSRKVKGWSTAGVLVLFAVVMIVSGYDEQTSSTTASQPVDPWVAAVNTANQANERQQSATGWDSWNSVARQWQEASNKMAAVPSNHQHYATAQEKVAQYSEAATNATAARDEFPQPAPPPVSQPKVDEIDIEVKCKAIVRSQLKNPRSAKFPFWESPDPVRNGNQWTWRAWVEATNAFNATVRTPFSCTIDTNGNLVDLTFQE